MRVGYCTWRDSLYIEAGPWIPQNLYAISVMILYKNTQTAIIWVIHFKYTFMNGNSLSICNKMNGKLTKLESFSTLSLGISARQACTYRSACAYSDRNSSSWTIELLLHSTKSTTKICTKWHRLHKLTTVLLCFEWSFTNDKIHRKRSLIMWSTSNRTILLVCHL